MYLRNIYKLKYIPLIMEQRKIIKFGNSSYVITLPLEWVKKHELNKGDCIAMAENEDSIIISVEKQESDKTAQISLDNVPLKLFNKQLISYYLKNFKYIKITCQNCIERLEEIKALKEKLSSVEIVEIQRDYIILKDLTSPEKLNIHSLISEIINMEKLLFRELRKGEGRDRQHLLTSLDANVNKLSFLAYKAINYNLDSWKNPREVKDTIHYRRIVSSFEELGDVLKMLEFYVREDKPYMPQIYSTIKDLENYFTFIASLITLESNLDNNLELYLDKKQSLLRQFEDLRDSFGEDVNLFLVIKQLFKGIIARLESILLSVIDLNCNNCSA